MSYVCTACNVPLHIKKSTHYIPLNYYLALAHFDGNYNNKQTQRAGTKIIIHITNNTNDLCTEQ